MLRGTRRLSVHRAGAQIILAAAAALALSGCVNERLSWRLAPPTPMGTSVTGGAVDAFAATAEEEPCPREGRSSSTSVLALVAFGNAGAASAARAGNVQRIRTADVEVIRVKTLGIPIMTRYTVIVRGE
jgi:hypothetical protein